jgi:hypothetical protein
MTRFLGPDPSLASFLRRAAHSPALVTDAAGAYAQSAHDLFGISRREGRE